MNTTPENKSLDTTILSSGSSSSVLSKYALRLAGISIVINLFIISISLYLLTISREQTVKQAEETVQNLSKILELNIDNDFDKMDIILQVVAREAQNQIINNGGINSQLMNEFMAHNNKFLDEFDELRMLDSSGKILCGTELPAELKVNLSGRDYFKFLRDNPKAGLYISKPFNGRIINEWLICLARRLNNPDGSFGGVVYGTIKIDFFTTLFKSINLKKGIVTLADENYEVIASLPEPAGYGSAVGRKIKSPQLHKLVQAGHDSGVYTSISSVDKQERTIYYRKIGNYPLRIFVGLSHRDYLSEWRHHAYSITALITLFSLCSIIICRKSITSKKIELLAEEQLRKSKEELEERVIERTSELLTSNRQLAHFSENLAHELRTPIHSLMIESDIALHETRTVEEYQNLINSNIESYLRLKRLIESLLFLARADNHQLSITVEEINLCEVLEDIVDFHSENLRIKEITSSIDCQAVLFADSVLFNRAVNNLLENAIRYTPNNGRIILSAHQQGNESVEITVKDTGCGIDPELLPKIVDRYFWIENQHFEERQGAGLGLDLVKSIMTLHGGSMTIESELGKGTAVILRFPSGSRITN